MAQFNMFVFLLFVATAFARHFDNPVLDGADYPDPGVILHEGVYYAVTTSNNRDPQKYPIHKSTDLQNWELVGFIFDESNFPSWSRYEFEFWAPEIHRVGDRFVVYFTSRDIGADRLVIGVASSANVTGPYVCAPEPILIAPTLILDSTLMKLNDGSLMLAWVEEYYITVGNLTDDGMAMKDDIKVRLFRPELDFEGPTTEGPWYQYRNGYHYMFYSGNDFCTDRYVLAVARSRNPSGPYEKYPEPLLTSNDQFKGPGHGSIVADVLGVEGKDYVFVHHGWKDGFICGSNFRLMFSTSMTWGDDDWPNKMSIGN